MFKTITMAAALAATLLTTTPVTAKEDVCASLAELAGDVMELRQGGVPLSEMMKIAEGDELLRFLLLEAYNVPRFSTKEYKDLAIKDFSDMLALVCYNEMGELL